MEAVIFIGLQASGKSSFYTERFFRTHIRLNLDMLGTRHRLHVLLRACIDLKQPFVLDNTNVTVAARAPYIALARSGRFHVTGYYFDTPVAECLQRNERREGRERVPTKGIFGTAKRLEAPGMSEGFDALYRVRPDGDGGFDIEAWGDEIQRT